MDQSLSVVLPIHNAQNTLARQVHELLEVLPELTNRFEILLIDDGSTDQTEDVALELIREYPQLRLTRHPWRLGTERAMKTGLEMSKGDIVFVQDERAVVSHQDLRRLWDLRKDQDVIMARPEPRATTLNPKLLNRLIGWGKALTQSTSQAMGQGGIQMIRRCALRDMEAPAAESKSPSIAMLMRSDSPSDNGNRAPKFISRVKNFATEE